MNLWERVRWDIARQYHQAKKVLLKLKIGDKWEADTGFARRQYPDYQTYVEHQKTKFSALRAKSIESHDRRFYAALKERLEAIPVDFRGRAVLCLAARQGSEVRAFIDSGAFAIGIDLNPGRNNKYVVVGDFHDLQYSDASLDFVYTNSLDHAFDLERILAEVRRVLKPEGGFIVEANLSPQGGTTGGPYESVTWKRAEDLLDYITARGFRLELRSPIQSPWTGEQLLFRAGD
jgi:SAM-dependent methyltransferase